MSKCFFGYRGFDKKKKKVKKVEILWKTLLTYITELKNNR